MTDALAMIAISYIRPKLEGVSDLIEKFKIAFAEAQEFWLTTDDQVRFKAAVAAVFLETSDPIERQRIEETAKFIGAISAAMSGVPVNLDAALPEGCEPLPLIGLWTEAKG